MSLRLPDLPLLLKPSDHELLADFFAPALSHAFRYDRGVGYSALGWLPRARRHWCSAIAALCYNLMGPTI
jgi:hypothetical protein